ncbi:hypothetical protein C0992_000717 [Termitomyces sp. T32_za158]|nr:hypothetical protein C0992_000717 [Termitomyces sp. T32_za158]
MTNPLKILAVGSAAGSIKDLFAKIKVIDAKHGKFDLVLCTGDFFGPQDDVSNLEDETSQLLAGELEAPIDCYIMQGDHPLPEKVVEKFAKDGGELCERVFLLSKSGIITTAHGLRIACLGGKYDADVYSTAASAPGFLSPHFSSQTLERLLSNSFAETSKVQSYESLAAIKSSASSSQLIDIFMTNVWPSAVKQLSGVALPLPELMFPGVSELDEVIRRIKPRYHFAASGGVPPQFWEREPFVWDDAEGRVSRFISLGAFGGAASPGKKPRWFYAFSIAPNPGQGPRPANASKNPFTEGVYRPAKRPHQSTEGENFIFGNCKVNQESHHKATSVDAVIRLRFLLIIYSLATLYETVQPETSEAIQAGKNPNQVMFVVPVEGERRGGKRGPVKEIGPDECWFCLSNPNLAKHLIVAIGSECYLTLPKGQIIPTQSSSDRVVVPGGGHILIVPITHFPTYTTLPEDLAGPVVEETEKYKSALQAMYAKHGAVGVAFEVGRLSAKGGHAHVQSVPVPLEFKDRLEDAFIQEGRQFGIEFEEDADAAMDSCRGGKGSYFKVNLPDGRKMVHLIKDHVPFSIQFGRQVLVNLLGMPDRFDWKACMLSEDEDKADAQAFKTAFAAFDPSG